ncbi:hypothetical protein ANCDUO_22375 [Ancylostoma duodenale]|uniref:DUF4440 domain-containing protein n=1 Tax=Ancylostoma duodenale TaxID=51022 RepID=A0A0C2CCH2_9BILA|nr:hypothetical protein ANCDUO_22375 [Ancylostoma duodenale]
MYHCVVGETFACIRKKVSTSLTAAKFVNLTVAFFDEDGVLVQAGKKGVYGKEAIKQELQEFDKLAGKRKMTKIISDTYQMTQDYVIITTDYESTTEKMGVLKGKATQIWKKSNNKYLIYHEMFSIA